jgi:hypothetical protein
MEWVAWRGLVLWLSRGTSVTRADCALVKANTAVLPKFYRSGSRLDYIPILFDRFYSCVRFDEQHCRASSKQRESNVMISTLFQADTTGPSRRPSSASIAQIRKPLNGRLQEFSW